MACGLAEAFHSRQTGAWGVGTHNLCYLCNSEEETHTHLFLKCPFVIDIWRKMTDFLPVVGILPIDTGNISELFDDIGTKLTSHWKIITSLVIYYIWKERNKKGLGINTRSSLDVSRIILAIFFAMYSFL